MPSRIPFCARRTAAATTWRLVFPPAALATVSLATLSAGVALLVAHQQAVPPGRVLAPAGVVLLVCGALQARSAWRLWSQRTTQRLLDRIFWERLFLGACVFYVAALLSGPIRDVGYAVLAATAVWYTLLVALHDGSLALVRRRSDVPSALPRRLVHGASAVMVVLAAAEVSLQLYRTLGPGQAARVADLALAGEQSASSALAADLSSANERLAHLKAGPLRVAVLCDKTVGGAGQDYVTRIEQSLNGIKIVGVNLPQPWTNMSPRDVAQAFAEARVDLVLAMLSVCDDLTRAVPDSSWFDWRQLEMVRLVRGTRAPVAAIVTGPSKGDFESFCSAQAPQLAACRTPIDERMRTRWQQTLQAVDELVAECDATRVEVALVVVPGEFQVNRALCATLARRSGYEPGQLDVDLPQRKLASYAAKRRVPVVDLLPSLRLMADSPYERNAATWNEDGHAAAAGAISGWLQSRYGRQLGISARLTSTPY